jgi:signal transduction histidine kinase
MPTNRSIPATFPERSGNGSTSSPHRATCADDPCIPCRILQIAARDVIGQWARRPRSTSAAEVAALLALLTNSIHLARTKGITETDERVRSILGRRLLDLLRAAVVAAWPTAEVPDNELQPLLAATEQVRGAIEPTWAQSFATHLSGSDGLALLMDVAHDLRSPLTSILVLAETLQRGQSGPVNNVQRRQLGLIYTAALGLSSVASDIIEFTQGGEQLVEQQPIAFSVAAMLEAVRDIVRPIAEEKRLTVRLLGPSADERMGHPVALSRVLLNLTTNALKFTDEGYVEVVAQERGGSRVEFAVRDSGKGIHPATVTTLFQPLRKEAGRGGHHFSQTGLGLTICRKLVTAMHSNLKVESQPGWGTRFFFELDLPACATRRSGPTRARLSGATSKNVSQRRVSK